MMTLIPIIFGFFKRHWYIALLASMLIYCYLKIRDVKNAYSKLLESTKAGYETQLIEVNRIRDVERAEHVQNLKELHESLDATQKKYEEDMKRMSIDSAKKIDRITRDFGKNPSLLAAEFSRSTGVKVAFDEVSK